MKHRIWLWLAIGFVPLLIYPFVFLANIMAYAAILDPHVGMANDDRLKYLVVVGFLGSSTLYPLVYFSCAARSTLLFKNKAHKKAITWAMLPIAYLIIPLLLIYAWSQY